MYVKFFYSFFLSWFIFSLQGMDSKTDIYKRYEEKIDFFRTLIKAIHRNDIPQINAILNTGVDVNYRYVIDISDSSHKETTLLEVACKDDNQEMVKFLLDSRAELTNGCLRNVTYRSSNNTENKIPMLVTLLEHYSKLPYTAKQNILPGIRYFLKERCLDVIAAHDWRFYSHQHAPEITCKLMRLCCAYGLPINDSQENDFPYLWEAARNWSLPLVKILLFYGADISFKNTRTDIPCYHNTTAADVASLSMKRNPTPQEVVKNLVIRKLVAIEPNGATNDRLNPVQKYPEEFKEEFAWYDNWQKEQLVKKHCSISNYLKKRELGLA